MLLEISEEKNRWNFRETAADTSVYFRKEPVEKRTAKKSIGAYRCFTRRITVLNLETKCLVFDFLEVFSGLHTGIHLCQIGTVSDLLARKRKIVQTVEGRL